MRFYILPTFLLSLLCGANSAIAQSFTPTAVDGLTEVTRVGDRWEITTKNLPASSSIINQFHSFTNFNVGAGEIVRFVPNGMDIKNILSRVTGGTPSQIQGMIQASGGVNLFLMNPAGILFGNGASLNVQGSFTATTANAIGFGNNNWFNAVGNNNYTNLKGDPNQFAFTNANPGAIVNTGNLTLKDGKSLNLIGGTVINTGTISTPGGNVTIAAVEGGRAVQITEPGSLLSYIVPIGAINPAIGNPASLAELLTGPLLDNASGIEVKNGVVTLVKSQTPLPDRSGLVVVAGSINSVGKTEIVGRTIALTNPLFDASSTSEKTAVQLTATDRIIFGDLGGNELKFGAGVKSLTMQTTAANGIIEALNPKDSIVVPNGKLQIKTDFVKLGNLEAKTNTSESAMNISAIQDITVGDLNTTGSIQLTSETGNIKARNISSSNKGSATAIKARMGNIEVETIEAGIKGDENGKGQLALDIFAGGTFRAIGTITREIRYKLLDVSDDVLDFIAKKIDKDSNINPSTTTTAKVREKLPRFTTFSPPVPPVPYLIISDVPTSIFVSNGETKIQYAGGAKPTNKFLNVTLQGGNSRFEIGAKEMKGSGDPYIASESFTNFLSDPFSLVKNSTYTPIVLAKGVSGTVGAILYSFNVDGKINIGIQDQAFGVLPTKLEPKLDPGLDPRLDLKPDLKVPTIDLENRPTSQLIACPDKKTIVLTPPEAITDRKEPTKPIKKNPCISNNDDDEILKILK